MAFFMPCWLHIGIKVMLIDIPIRGQDRLILFIVILVFAFSIFFRHVSCLARSAAFLG